METLGDRLRIEREALGLTQSQFAELGGVKKNAQINYEAGKRSPDLAYLAAVAEHGVDALYVVTGQRMSPSAHRVIELNRKLQRTFEIGDVAEHVERLKGADPTRDREDLERMMQAFQTVNEALGSRRLGLERRAELILLAYDILEDDAASSKERIIRLVKAAT